MPHMANFVSMNQFYILCIFRAFAGAGGIVTYGAASFPCGTVSPFVC